MNFHTYTTTREACKRSGTIDDPKEFYRAAFTDAVKMGSGQFFAQLHNEQDWEKARRPYYNVWPSIVPMLTRLNLDLDSGLIKLPMPALCVRFPQENNPLIFDWKGEEIPIRCILMGDMGQGKGISILIDVGEVMGDGNDVGVPIYTYRNFRRESGLTVEAAIRELGPNTMADLGVQIPDSLVMDCIRLCCSLCLLENDPSIISPDVLSKDRDRFEKTSDEKYVDKAHRRGKVGWDVGRQVEVMPHYRRPHLMLAWTGTGRAVPKIVPRRGSIVHREVVGKVPSGWEG